MRHDHDDESVDLLIRQVRTYLDGDCIVCKRKALAIVLMSGLAEELRDATPQSEADLRDWLGRLQTCVEELVDTPRERVHQTVIAKARQAGLS